MGLNLLKFATSNISNMPNSVLMSKISFMKYLPPVRPKLIPKLKSSEVIEIWHIRYFKYANFDYDVKNGFYEIFANC